MQLHFAKGLLEESDLDVATKELDAFSSKWYTLGKELLFKDQLDSIHAQNLLDNHLCLREVLSKRMTGSYALTWSDIVAGLRSSGDSQLAKHLETKYCSSELTAT